MIRVHQAIYGDFDGAYSLLRSSFPNQETPKRLGNPTDLIDRPPSGVLSKPIIRGFSKDKYFLLIKSFPDVSPDVRRGRVFSHVLIIEDKDFLKVQDITVLLQHHLATPDKEVELQLITINNHSTIPVKKLIDKGRVAYAINGLLDHTDTENTIVWVGEDGYYDWISHVWPNLPNPVKTNIKIGVAFDPQKVNSNLLNLLYVPLEVKANWLKSNIKLVELQDEEYLISQAANLLAGNNEKAQELQTLITEFELKIKEIDDLVQFEKLIPAFNSTKSAYLKQLLIFADLVSKYNPSPKSAFLKKENLLKEIVSKASNATANEINVLDNPDWAGFENAQNKLSVVLNSWLDKNLYLKGSGNANAVFIEKAFTKSKKNWWTTTLVNKLKNSITNWKPDFAKCVWDWFVTKPQLVGKLESILPDAAGIDLASKLPKLEQDIAKKILQLAFRKKWLQLHGLLAVEIHTPHEAISKQLTIDLDAKHTDVLEGMAKKMAEKTFISTAIKIGNQRLYFISGKLIKAKPVLLDDLQIEQNGWQEIWLETVKQGTALWGGIPDPKYTLFSILDHIHSGQDFNGELLTKISSNSYNDLQGYPKRQAIWDVLPQKSRDNFLTATSLSCIKTVANSKLLLKDLEEPLLKHLQTTSIIQAVLKNASIGTLFKINLFDELPKIGQIEAIYLIDNIRFNANESMVFGQKIQNSDWGKVANHLDTIISRRPDVKLMIQQCFKLLGFWERLNLKIRGYTTNAITDEEWWNALTNRAIVLFPKGPHQNGIWEAAGGDNADLNYNLTGKEMWKQAIHKVRYGGKPNAKKILEEMLHEYPFNDLLKKLKNTI